MMIWKGWGPLVAASVLIGAPCGSWIANQLGYGAFAASISGVLMVVINWSICKMLYAPPARPAFDPAGNEIKPEHSLFFIPARYFTFLFLAIAILSVIGDFRASTIPGNQAFNAANNLIETSLNGTGNGNTSSARAAANHFAPELRRACEDGFTNNDFSKLVGSQYPTYCQETSDTVLFLCNVPELDRYRDPAAKQALMVCVWKAAVGAAAVVDPQKTKTIRVALRKSVNFKFGLKGRPDEETPFVYEVVDDSEFYELFVGTP